MRMFTHNFAQDEVTHQRLRVGSKKHALSLPEGSVQQGRSHFYTRSVCGIREYGKMARTPLAAFFNRPIRVKATAHNGRGAKTGQKPGYGDQGERRWARMRLEKSGA